MIKLKEGGSDRKNRRRRNERVCRGIWDEEGREEFGERLGGIEMGEGKIQEHLGELEGRMGGALEETEKGRRGRYGERKGWWDEKCKKKRMEMRRTLRK